MPKTNAAESTAEKNESTDPGERDVPPPAPGMAFLSLALTIREASEMLRLDARTIRTMVQSGELAGNRRGHAIRVSRASVVDWLCGKRRVPRSKR